MNRLASGISKCVLLVSMPELISSTLSETGEALKASGGGVVVMSDKYTVSGPNVKVSPDKVLTSNGTATGYNDHY